VATPSPRPGDAARFPGRFCSEVSRDTGEPLGATASRVDRWLLVEYRGLWGPDAVAASGLSDQVKNYLRDHVRAAKFSRVLFVRRPDRRRRTELAVFTADSREGHERLAYHEVEAYDDLRRIDVESGGSPVDHPLFLVCTHGKHDPCCARHGRPLFEGLAELLDERWVWQTTHIGGDRFAGNLVCLPHGLYYGRVGRGDAAGLLDEHLAGRILLDRYRGRSAFSFPVQAAERSIREDSDLVGIDDLTFAGLERDGNALRVSFAGRDGRTHERDVVEKHGDLTFLTCSSETLQRPRHFVARPD
jgi:hypothetical protein